VESVICKPRASTSDVRPENARRPNTAPRCRHREADDPLHDDSSSRRKAAMTVSLDTAVDGTEAPRPAESDPT
jgi:hypothetical protein